MSSSRVVVVVAEQGPAQGQVAALAVCSAVRQPCLHQLFLLLSALAVRVEAQPDWEQMAVIVLRLLL
jgi:hypothetical protein